MRPIHNAERVKRGCAYCTDMKLTKGKGGKNQRKCPHNACPYKELDEFESYGDYLKSKGSCTLSAIMQELGLGPL